MTETMTRTKKHSNNEPRLADENRENQSTGENPNKVGTLDCLFRKPSPFVEGTFLCTLPLDSTNDSCKEFSWLVGKIHCALDPDFKTEDCGYAQRNGSKRYMCQRPDTLACEFCYKRKGIEYCKIRI